MKVKLWLNGNPLNSKLIEVSNAAMDVGVLIFEENGDPTRYFIYVDEGRYSGKKFSPGVPVFTEALSLKIDSPIF